MNHIIRLVALLLLLAACEDTAGPDTTADTGNQSASGETGDDAAMAESDADGGESDAQATPEVTTEPMCADDTGCAPVYDEGCNCIWLCLPPGEIPEECGGTEPCPPADRSAMPVCGCHAGVCAIIE